MRTLTILSLALITFLFWFQDQPHAHSYSGKPPVFNAGAPGMSSCSANSCHAGSPNSGAGMVDIIFDNGTENYTKGATTNVQIVISDPNANRYGFQMVAFDEDGASIGNFIADSDQNTSIQNSAGFQFINHNSVPNNNPNTFNFEWTAPEEGNSAVTFYVAANAANGTGNANGDLIYTNSLSVPVKIETGIDNPSSSSLTIYPQPVQDHFYIDFESQIKYISLLNINGQKVFEWNNLQINNQQQFEIPSDITGGNYLLRITDSNDRTHLQKLIVQ